LGNIILLKIGKLLLKHYLNWVGFLTLILIPGQEPTSHWLLGNLGIPRIKFFKNPGLGWTKGGIWFFGTNIPIT